MGDNDSGGDSSQPHLPTQMQALAAKEREAVAQSANGTVGTQASTVSFFLLTTFYSMFAFILSNSSDPKSGAQSQLIYFAIYIGLVIVSQYYYNGQMASQYCQDDQTNTATMMTIVPWVSIFGVVAILLRVFQGWVSPFANTFGYGFAKLRGLDSLMTGSILKPPDGVDDQSLRLALADIMTDPSIIFNQIPRDTDAFDVFWNRMKPLLKDGAGEYKEQLRRLVGLKYAVGYYVWYMLAGTLSISFSLNWLMSSGCGQDAAKMLARHADYEACLAGDHTKCPAEMAASVHADQNKGSSQTFKPMP